MKITKQTLEQSLADFTAFKSAIFPIGSGARVGIEIVTDYETAPAVAPTMNIMCSVSGNNFGLLKNAAGQAVTLTLNSDVNIFSLFEGNIQYIQLVGKSNGDAGELTEINIGTVGG